MTNALANLQSPAVVGTQAMHGLQQGFQMRERVEAKNDQKQLRAALGEIASDPENKAALSTVFALDPKLGASLMDRADEVAFARDTAQMMVPQGQPNALLGMAPRPATAPQGSQPVQNALVGAAPSAFETAFGQSAPQSAAPAPASSVGNAPAPAGADLSYLGEPQTGADKAFLRMVQRDPIKALKIRSGLRDNFIDQAQAESDFYGFGVAELSRATDQNSWDAALRSVLPRAKALGIDLMQAVPAAYPGPEGVQELMERALPIKEQLDYLLRETNMEADNERADRNTASLIQNRQERLIEYKRHNKASEGNTRRGQDITDRRVRSRPSAKRSKRRSTAIPTVATPAEAMKLKSGTKFKTPDGQVKVRP